MLKGCAGTYPDWFSPFETNDLIKVSYHILFKCVSFRILHTGIFYQLYYAGKADDDDSRPGGIDDNLFRQIATVTCRLRHSLLDNSKQSPDHYYSVKDIFSENDHCNS